MRSPLSLLDWVTFLCFFLFLSVILAYFGRARLKPFERPYFLGGAIFKILLGVCSAMLFKYYYHGGDTLLYYKVGISLTDYIDGYSSRFIDVILLGNIDDIMASEFANPYMKSSNAFLIMRIVAFLSYFTFQSYLTIGMFFSLFSFWGCWRLYQSITKYIHQDTDKIVAFFLLFFPSFIFWTSNVLKDTIVMGSVGLFIYSLMKIVFFREHKVKVFLLLILSIVLMNSVKAYVAQSMTLATLVLCLAILIGKFKSPIIKAATLMTSLTLISAIIILNSTLILQTLQEAVMDDIVSTAARQGAVLNYIADEGSSNYSLGVDLINIQITPQIMGKLVPYSIITTLYRPFLWEARKPLVLFSAVENLLALLFTLYVVFHVGFIPLIRIISRKPFLIFLTAFIFTMAFAVGISSGNFGTLSRYRTPCIALFYILLYLILYYKKTHEQRIHH